MYTWLIYFTNWLKPIRVIHKSKKFGKIHDRRCIKSPQFVPSKDQHQFDRLVGCNTILYRRTDMLGIFWSYCIFPKFLRHKKTKNFLFKIFLWDIFWIKHL